MPLWLTPLLLRIVAAAAMALTIFAAGWHFGAVGPREDLMRVRAEVASSQAQAEAKARKQETDWAAQVAAVETDHAQRTAALAADLDAARAAGDGLRRALAAGPRGAAAASGPTCGADDGAARARLLAELLGELDDLAGQSARAADERGEQVRALQDWVNATM